MSQRTSCTYIATVGGAGITVPTGSGTIFCGFALNGSAGGTTLTIKDGTTTIMSTTAAGDALINDGPVMPLACPNGIVASCSGTGSYAILFYK
jgi:hypothetical protein